MRQVCIAHYSETQPTPLHTCFQRQPLRSEAQICIHPKQCGWSYRVTYKRNTGWVDWKLTRVDHRQKSFCYSLQKLGLSKGLQVGVCLEERWRNIIRALGLCLERLVVTELRGKKASLLDGKWMVEFKVGFS